MMQGMRQTLRVFVLALGLSALGGAPAQALEFVDVIPAGFAAGFDVATPEPDWVMSTDPANFLLASPNPADNAAITFEIVSDCFLWGGVTECQGTVPEGTEGFSGVSTWRVTDINVPVGEDGLLLFIGGIADADYIPFGAETSASVPDYQQGDVELLIDGGDFGGSFLSQLEELYLPLGPGFDRSYFGVQVFEVGDEMTFGYRVNQQLPAGTPIVFANVAAEATVIPEPGTALLVGSGLAMLARGRARRERLERS